MVGFRFVCQFNIEGRVTSVNAQLLGDTIYCDEMEFTYTSRAPNVTATFAVIWGQSKPLDNPDNIHLVIYRCKEMANNCGMCLSLDEKYQCGWCQVCLFLPSSRFSKSVESVQNFNLGQTQVFFSPNPVCCKVLRKGPFIILRLFVCTSITSRWNFKNFSMESFGQKCTARHKVPH